MRDESYAAPKTSQDTSSPKISQDPSSPKEEPKKEEYKFITIEKVKDSKAKAETKAEKAKADTPKTEKAKAEKAKTEKAKTDKPKTEKAKTDKPKTEKIKIEKAKKFETIVTDVSDKSKQVLKAPKKATGVKVTST